MTDALELGDGIHELILGTNHAECSCEHWSVAATAKEAPRMHANHIRSADSNGAISCIFCGRVETAFMHGTNHGGAMGYLRDDGACMAMHLTRNHVLYVAKQPADIRVKQLPERIEIARALWQRKGAEWLDEYEPLCRPIDAPVHRELVASEAVSLW